MSPNAYRIELLAQAMLLLTETPDLDICDVVERLEGDTTGGAPLDLGELAAARFFASFAPSVVISLDAPLLALPAPAAIGQQPDHA